jgi:hypothetical protein
MGDNFEVVVDVEATLDEAPRLGMMMIAWLGVEGIIDTSPTDDRATHSLTGTTAGRAPSPVRNNGSVISVNEWQWRGDWPIAVGHLGFTFWNWPLLHPNFVGQIGDQLGHRVVTTRGKL